MIKRMACLIILLSFLMIKHSPLFLIAGQDVIAACQAEDDQKEVPEENKEPKQVEFADEEAVEIHFRTLTTLSGSQIRFFFPAPETTTVYLSVSNPPPDQSFS
ncbi:hypothetical protein [Pedobacter sp. GR22-6]|uniref:hypothetical protein n=1 Tax=Pedobacter sp. GR22-6 TaxID=3127957 RepID=UPI00307E7147